MSAAVLLGLFGVTTCLQAEDAGTSTHAFTIGDGKYLVLHVAGEKHVLAPGDRIVLTWDEQTAELHLNEHRVRATPWERSRQYDWKSLRARYAAVPSVSDAQSRLAAEGVADSAAWVAGFVQWKRERRAVMVRAWDVCMESRGLGSSRAVSAERALAVVCESDLVERAELMSAPEDWQVVVGVQWKGVDYTEHMLLKPDDRPMERRPTHDRGFTRREFEMATSLLTRLSIDSASRDGGAPILMEFGDGNVVVLTGEAAERHELYGSSDD
jgi:hypothetical protein